MSPSPSSFLVPFTFSQLGASYNYANHQIMEASCSTIQPRIIKGWGNMSSRMLEVGLDNNPVGGALIVSQDGTLYLFGHSCRSSPTGHPQPEFLLSRPTSPSRLSRDSRVISRSSTPSVTSSPPFNVTSRPRVVSGITTEQVQAPKNYVDFDEEPSKLKDMLKGRHPKENRERSITPDCEFEGDAIHDKSTAPSFSSLKRKNMARSPLSASPALPTNSLPSPSSRDLAFLDTIHDLSLWCHIVPPQPYQGRAITSICLFGDNRFLAVLQETGDVSIFLLQDGSCLAAVKEKDVTLQPPSGIKDWEVSHDWWLWDHLEVYRIGESTILLASAMVDPAYVSSSKIDPEDSSVTEKSRLAIFEFHADDHLARLEARIIKIGQWYFSGTTYSIGLHQESDNVTTFFTITTEGHFVVRNLQLLPHGPVQREIPLSDIPSTSLGSLPLPNPFKALKPRSAEHVPFGDDMRAHGRVVLGGERDLGELTNGSPYGIRTRSTDGRMLAITWSRQDLTVFEYRAGCLYVLYVNTISNIKNIEWMDDLSYTILFQDRVESYSIRVGPNTDNTDGIITPEPVVVRSELLRTIPLDRYEIADISLASCIVTTSITENGTRKLTYFETVTGKSRILWKANFSRCDLPQVPEVTSLLPLDLDIIVGGYADGRVRRSTLIQLISGAEKHLPPKMAESLNGYVTSLYAVQNSRTKERFFVGGADDGSIAFWTADHLKLCARWTVFVAPLINVIQIRDVEHGPLRGCVLCISADGTIAVIGIDGFQFLYIVPGAAAPLSKIQLGGNNLLLVYADRRARLWDVKRQEFWRSMSLEKVDELLDEGGWTDLSLDVCTPLPNPSLKAIPGWSKSPDIASTLILDLEQFTMESIAVVKSISTNRDQTRIILLTLERLRAVLSPLLTPGLNDDIDKICFTRLGIPMSRTSTGVVSCGSITLYQNQGPQDPWCLSGEASAARALSITVVLNALGLFEEFMEGANTVMIFYATSLASSVGPSFRPPSLVYLACRWFDGSNEVRRSARVLFDYAVACLSDEESNEVAEHWQHHLPCLQPDADRESINAALALFLCGYLASEKYSLLSTSALTDISKSIALYLHDEKSLHRVLAVDLCSRGFHIWQHYIDAMEILRALFTLATTSRKESINLQNIGAQARLAVLQIASSNTALFMTTLGLDILNPPTLEHRRSVLQIVAFLIRRRPLVLQPNVPKLMEAVVKSLDPNVTTHREAVLDTATEIIGYVVKTFPSVDFYMASQRLAVGSNEGALIMYDLKTAIRLYVLEGHKKPISACSFSPDGRRLLTLSLEENVVLVWKVGSSFTSFFNPGAPPRQGHSGSEPFKTINFNFGDEGNMNVQGTMEWVRFEWIADRSVKLKIRDNIMTFST